MTHVVIVCGKINYGEVKLFSAEGKKNKKKRTCHRQTVISAVVVKYHLHNFWTVVNEVVE
jgi:hypothetical protein